MALVQSVRPEQPDREWGLVQPPRRFSRLAAFKQPPGDVPFQLEKFFPESAGIGPARVA